MTHAAGVTQTTYVMHVTDVTQAAVVTHVAVVTVDVKTNEKTLAGRPRSELLLQ